MWNETNHQRGPKELEDDPIPPQGGTRKRKPRDDDWIVEEGNQRRWNPGAEEPEGSELTRISKRNESLEIRVSISGVSRLLRAK